MGFRFRKSFTLAPGIRFNLGLRSASVSMFGLTIGTRGASAGFSIPGTGVSYRTRLTSSPVRRRRVRRVPAAPQPRAAGINFDHLVHEFAAQRDRAEKLAADRQRKLSAVKIA